MESISLFTFQPPVLVVTSNLDYVRIPEFHTTSSSVPIVARNVSSQLNRRRFASVQRRCSYSNPKSAEEEGSVEEIRIPNAWLDSSKALEESEWLRVTLHKWLDDEYCPEPTNVDISTVAARSYYKSLTESQTDLGDILLRMAMDLETISYQESFHGAFSSANAAINLILQRIMQE
uniref:uncharacterized protein LOC122592577 n=1 Tax=Erigeron canadensis TaxID=72917 RepID=UPI001CB9A83A|nr:uncharacterized protein LOC122592577 [Erigeron canadensis]XP_043620771.1 uncharacterized protein LOC122592577 [Erigeron canadensis]XP_043620772.1 uncharacterized protein LOC122592577 [Erigeron canadensis]XP_043620773.1 uncharacterized protein LOC122592577 [Erigeron canadensis]